MKARLTSLVALGVAGVLSAAGMATARVPGSAPVAHPPLAISASIDSSTKLYPGASIDVAVRLTNNMPHRLALRAGRLQGAVSNLPAGCRRAWFRFAGDSSALVILAGSGGTGTTHGRLTLVDADTDQSACSDATVALHISDVAGGRR